MKNCTLPVLLVLLALSVAAVGCRDAASSAPGTSAGGADVVARPLPYYADGDFTPHWFDSRADVPDDFHAIPAFVLTDQKGRTITEADLDGRITVANFFFTACPGICPMTTANMRRVQEAFSNDAAVVLLSHSVTPDADSVAALQAFAERTEVLADRWHLVTGERAEIYALGKSAYFADDDLGEATPTPDAAFTHTESFYLLDGDRRIRGIYNGMNTAAVSQLIDDVRTLRQESAD